MNNIAYAYHMTTSHTIFTVYGYHMIEIIDFYQGTFTLSQSKYECMR